MNLVQKVEQAIAEAKTPTDKAWAALAAVQAHNRIDGSPTPSSADNALREALEPFAKEADTWFDKLPDDARPWIAEPGNVGGDNAEFTIGDLRRLRNLYAALSQPGSSEIGKEA